MKTFRVEHRALLYDNKFQKFPGKLEMHWLGPFIVAEIKGSGMVRLTKLDGGMLLGWVNGACLKFFHVLKATQSS